MIDALYCTTKSISHVSLSRKVRKLKSSFENYFCSLHKVGITIFFKRKNVFFN